MSKAYMIWWHSRFVDEINRDVNTIDDILDKAGKTLKHLEELKQLEKEDKIKVKVTKTLNPICWRNRWSGNGPVRLQFQQT